MSCVVLSLWETKEAAAAVYDRQGYNQGIVNAKNFAAEGTFTDIVEKANSRRLFSVTDGFFFDANERSSPTREESESEKYYFNLKAVPKELL